jgi:hypothetical protein
MATAFEHDAILWNSESKAMTEDIREIARIHDELNPGFPFPYGN